MANFKKVFGLDPVSGIKESIAWGQELPGDGQPSPTAGVPKNAYGKQDEGFDTEAQQRQKYLQSLEGQVAAKRATADQFGGQIEASKAQAVAERANLRRRAAQALAGVQARGMGGGGAILTLGNQAAADRGLAEGQLAAQFQAQQADLAAKRALAGEAVAGAETEVIAEKRKMLDVERGYDKALNDLKDKVRKDLSEQGWIFSTDADKAKAIARAKAEYAGQLPSAQRAIFLQWLDTEAATGDVEGRWDI